MHLSRGRCWPPAGRRGGRASRGQSTARKGPSRFPKLPDNSLTVPVRLSNTLLFHTTSRGMRETGLPCGEPGGDLRTDPRPALQGPPWAAVAPRLAAGRGRQGSEWGLCGRCAPSAPPPQLSRSGPAAPGSGGAERQSQAPPGEERPARPPCAKLL